MTVVVKKNSTKKPNIALCAGFILLCLTLFSMHFTSGLYARYISRDSAEDSARVIKFGELTLKETGDFVKDGTPVKAVIIPGSDLTKKVTVSFTGSESATYVFVKVTLNKWYYSDGDSCYYIGTSLLKWTPNTGENKWTKLPDKDVYYVELKPNEVLSELDFIADDGLIEVSSSIEKSAFVSLDGMLIQLQAFAVQSNGFESVEKAWESISVK